MSFFDDPPLHDFPDRAIRKLLENPHNLRDLLEAVVPGLVARFDFERVEIVPRTFLLDDWRRRESDILFRIPFTPDRNATDEKTVLVCVLIEHQSEPDPRMPLRTLLYAMLYWEREWKAWEDGHGEGEPLRLSPVLPIVFHTGPRAWNTNREFAALIDGPEELRPFAPTWRPVFWDLSERTPRELLEAAGEWMQALAVVRAEREESEEFRRVFGEVLQRLEGLSDRETLRWHDLLWFVLSWALRRRPSHERQPLMDAARRSQVEDSHQQEIETMSETIEKTWEQEMFERGESHGRVLARREDLRILLEERFGSLPDRVTRKIEETDDIERLSQAIRQVLRMTSLEEFSL